MLLIHVHCMMIREDSLKVGWDMSLVRGQAAHRLVEATAEQSCCREFQWHSSFQGVSGFREMPARQTLFVRAAAPAASSRPLPSSEHSQWVVQGRERRQDEYPWIREPAVSRS